MSGTPTPPLKWHGGKNYQAKGILALMPRHLHYVEPYFGSGQVLFARDPQDPRYWWEGETSDHRRPDGVSECINDLHRDLMNLYAVLKDPDLFDRLRRRLELTLFSQAEWEAARGLLAGPGGDDVARAAALFTLCRQSMGARMKNFTPTERSRLRGGRNGGVNAWWGAVDGLEAVHHRLRDVCILCRPALEVIAAEDTPATLFYLDPPYIHGSRTAAKVYHHEMTDAEHSELLDALAGVKGRFLLSGYPNALYDAHATRHGWHRKTVDVPNHAAGGASKRRMTEVVWANFAPRESP
jgi:DNA adenine methylase